MRSEVYYLDWNSTTPLRPEAAEAMRRVEAVAFGNPASAHAIGRKARRYLEDAREQIAALLGAKPSEVTFTSSATESNNLAVFGALKKQPLGSAALAAEIEHPCITGPLGQLESQGYHWQRIPVPRSGRVEIEAIREHARPSTRFISLMAVNHETGVIQPVHELAREFAGRCVVHCDAAQLVGKQPMNFHDFGVSTLTASAHKFGGPKACGLLLVREGVELQPLIYGGHQQQSRRPGTESASLAAGTAAALAASLHEYEQVWQNLHSGRAKFLKRLEELVAPVFVNGEYSQSIPTTLNLSFPGCRADLLLMQLDLAGVACSTGSACSSGSLTPSTVLRAMKIPDDLLRSALRFSFGPCTTEDEFVRVAEIVAQSVAHVRQRPT